MPIPSRDDARWPLYMSVRHLSTLSVLIFLLGALLCVPAVHHSTWLSGLFIAILLLAPGALMFLLTVMIYRRKRWAVIVMITLIGFIELSLIFLLAAVARQVGLTDLVRGKNTGGTMLVILAAILLMLTAKAMYRLFHSFPALILPPLRDTGFEPLMQPVAQPVLRAEAVDDDAAAAR
jgi:hypothetical protein